VKTLKDFYTPFQKEIKEKESKEKITKKEVVAEVKEVFITHLVERKETLYSISKKYGVTMETLCELNPELKTANLKVGAKLKLPASNKEASVEKAEGEAQDVVAVKVEEVKSVGAEATTDVMHKVLPKETLFRISKQYGVTINDLKKLNPSINNELPVGFDLVIKKATTQTISNTADVASKEVDAPVDDEDEVRDVPDGNREKADFLINKASENLGARYRSGGTSPAGFDCSGLMFSTFKNIDMTLPRSSHEMATIGYKIGKKQAQKGDLIFFSTFGRGRISHVGMITEIVDDEIKFIHSSTGSGVIVSSTKEPYYQRTFVQINRVLVE
jgi:cell wall-associated NlpC family hydrolase